jgi:hypothetical protein
MEHSEDRKRAEDTLRRENVALREEIDKASMFENENRTFPCWSNTSSIAMHEKRAST